MKKGIVKNILFTVIIISQVGCLSYLQYQSKKDDPISQLGDSHYVRLDATWTTEQAQKLLKIFNSISPDQPTHHSVWKISNEDLGNDIKIETQAGIKSVTISRDVFQVDESEQALPSDKRLFMAVVQFISEHGTNRPALKRILQERYGISVDVTEDVKDYILMPTYAAANVSPKGFSEIDNEDLMTFISILEAFPKVLHKFPQLKHIVSRDEELGGGAAAKAWTSSGFIEFKKSILDNIRASGIKKILAHEKAHFLWSHLFPTQLKNEWIKLGGWYRNPESEHGWSTNKKRSEFITNYAFTRNPNEDMADSLAYYLVYPEKLRNCNMEKYNFIHQKIILMYGNRYIPPDMM